MQLTMPSFGLRYTRLRFRAAAPCRGVVSDTSSELLLSLATVGDADGGTYREGRLTCRPDLVCVAVGATSDSSELESPARMTSSPSLSLPRRRFLRLGPLVVLFRWRGPTAALLRLADGGESLAAGAIGWGCEGSGGSESCGGAGAPTEGGPGGLGAILTRLVGLSWLPWGSVDGYVCVVDGDAVEGAVAGAC